ncbi:glycosyltransferase family 2 protein [Alishewanella longhuensis]
MIKIAVAAIFKNERPYVLEWVAYHRLMGADQIIIADNFSDDGTSQLLEALHLAGIIIRIPYPRVGEEGPQAGAYNTVLRDFGSRFDLIAFIDADEFIVGANPDINPFEQLRNVFLMHDDLSAIALNWRIYGSAANFYFGEGFVLERFSACSEPEMRMNYHIKSVVRPENISFMAIHHAELTKGRYYSASGEPVDFMPDNPAFSTKIYDSAVLLHHYVVKSATEHQQFKCLKGSAAGDSNRRKGQGYFELHDTNSVQRPLPQGLLMALERHVFTIKQALHGQTPYFSFVDFHLDEVTDKVAGWLVCDKMPISIKVIINQSYEFVVAANLERHDVVLAGKSNTPYCGFSWQIPKELFPIDDLEVTVFGANIRLYPKLSWSE